MKGYELIILANGILFLVLGVFVLFNGVVLEKQGLRCSSGNQTVCDRDLDIGHATKQVAPWISAVGVLLLGLGSSLVLHRRWFRPGMAEPDQGPTYP
jgi:hypothetical protein